MYILSNNKKAKKKGTYIKDYLGIKFKLIHSGSSQSNSEFGSEYCILTN